MMDIYLTYKTAEIENSESDSREKNISTLKEIVEELRDEANFNVDEDYANILQTEAALKFDIQINNNKEEENEKFGEN